MLRIWDESYLPAKAVSITVDELNGLASYFRLHFPYLIEDIENFVKRLDEQTDDTSFEMPAMFRQLDIAVSSGKESHEIGSDRFNILQSLQIMCSRQMIYKIDRKRKGVLIGASAPIPEDIAPLFILDGSIRCREIYSRWEEAGGKVVRLSPKAADYRNLKVHMWNKSAGKTALIRKEDQKVILKAITPAILSKPKEGWLTISHKLISKCGIMDKIDRISSGTQKVEFVNWGAHTAINRYNDYKNVIVIGAWNSPYYAYLALDMAATGKPLPGDAEVIQKIRQGEFKHNLLQAISRGNVRNHAGGYCGECQVYLINKSIADQASLIRETFPYCTVIPWEPEERPLKGRAKAVADMLLKLLSEAEDGCVTKKSLQAACGYSTPSALRSVTKQPVFNRFLKKNGVRTLIRHFMKV